MNTNAQVFGNNFTTTGAFLRRATRVHQDDGSTSLFSFVERVLCELSPRHVRDAAVDGVIAQALHILNVEFLEDHELIDVHQFPAFLMREIGAAVRDTLVGMVQRVKHLVAFRRTLLEVFFLTLKPSNVCRVPFHPALTLNLAAVAEIGEGLQPQIHTNRIGCRLKRLRFDFAREADVPLTGAVTLNGDGLDFAFNGTMQLDLNDADFRDGQAITDQFHPVAVLWGR